MTPARAGLRLKPGLNSPEQPEAHLVVIARGQDHKTHPRCPSVSEVSKTQSRHREQALDWRHQGLLETRPLVFALPTFTQPAAWY